MTVIDRADGWARPPSQSIVAEKKRERVRERDSGAQAVWRLEVPASADGAKDVNKMINDMGSCRRMMPCMGTGVRLDRPGGRRIL